MIVLLESTVHVMLSHIVKEAAPGSRCMFKNDNLHCIRRYTPVPLICTYILIFVLVPSATTLPDKRRERWGVSRPFMKLETMQSG